MGFSGIVLPGILITVLTFGFILDAYSVFVKVTDVDGLAETLAMANLVQYLARISNVVVVFILSFSFETGRLSANISFLFLVASLLGLIAVLCLIYSSQFCNFITICLHPILHLSFAKISKIPVWRNLERVNRKSFKLAGISVITNAMIILAMFVPFGIASYYPEMRMTSVYVGQLVNFFATLLIFAVQDPVSMRLVDGGTLVGAGSALLFGRALSYLLSAFVFLVLLFA